MKIAFILCILVFTLAIASAQENTENWPPAFEIKSETFPGLLLPDSNWQMLPDKSNALTIEQVSQMPLSARFHVDSTKSIDYSIHTHWLRYRVRNGLTRPLKIGVFLNWDYEDFYAKQDGSGWRHLKSGLMLPWSKRDGLNLVGLNMVELEVDPGKTLDIYQRVYSRYVGFGKFQNFLVALGTTEKAIQFNAKDETHYCLGMHDAFFFGLALFAALFNFLFFLIVREKVYLYFALYLLALGWGRMHFDFEAYHLFFREHPVFSSLDQYFIWPFALFFQIYFIRQLLKTGIHYPKWDKFLGLVNWLPLLSTVFMYFVLPEANWTWMTRIELIDNILRDLVHLALITTFFLFIKSRDPSTRTVLLAVFPAVIVWEFFWHIDIIYQHWGVKLAGEKFTIWVDQHWERIETICLVWQIAFFSIILLRRFSQLRKQLIQQALEKEQERNQLMTEQKVELEKQVQSRTAELKNSLENLKSTQAQLVHAEKMASLGELTAGIAHEIQNPLNFVNNFSEVNTELIGEMKLALKAGNIQEALSVSDDIEKNLSKIGDHGKRADSIVKGMLQHSRGMSGNKELTDINILCEEWLRLAYHGMRAREKDFNVKMTAEYDPALKELNIDRQDLGRVILNIFNNAFYALGEKRKSISNGYEPELVLKTMQTEDKSVILIRDNGIGIPEKIREKIFHPFFTTKPTGQGTGLGLSLSYDIIKAMGGEIKVESKEGEWTEFTISLNGTHT